MGGVMKVIFCVLAVQLWAVSVLAAGSPVIVTHQVARSNLQGSMQIFDVSVSVKNISQKPISNLTLLCVPKPPLLANRSPQKIEGLQPGETANFHIEVQLPLRPGKGLGEPQKLLWAGKYDGELGGLEEFPVTSHSGGE